MVRKIWIALALTLLASAAFAAGPRAVREQAEMSMLVTGLILIESDGSVTGWELDQAGKLPPAVVELVGSSAPAWRFEPVLVDGRAQAVKARMSLRIVAAREEGRSDTYRVEIRSGYFGRDALNGLAHREGSGPDSLKAIEMQAPSYPTRAMMAGVQGTVYLAARVDRHGLVDDVFVEQVNLWVVGSETQMRAMRQLLARSTMAAARKWKFQVPTTGADAGDDYWVIRIPTEYRLRDHDGRMRDQSAYGVWDVYIPGPRSSAPWSQGHAAEADQGLDAMAVGELHIAGRGLKLVTSLQQRS